MPPPQELELHTVGQLLVVRLGSGGEWRLPNPPAPADLEPVVTAARAASRGRPLQLLIRGAFDVPEAARRVVGRALSDGGAESVFCAKDNSNCR